MPDKPVGGEADYPLERPGFFEEVAGARDQRHLLLATELAKCRLVHGDDVNVKATDNQQCWRGHRLKKTGGKIRSPAARNDRRDAFAELCCRYKGGCGAGAGAEVSDRPRLGIHGSYNRVCRQKQSPGKTRYVEHIRSVFRFLHGQKIEQERSHAMAVEALGNRSIARAETAAAASMREYHDTPAVAGQNEIAGEAEG